MQSCFRAKLEDIIRKIKPTEGSLLDVGGDERSVDKKMSGFNPARYVLLDINQNNPQAEQVNSDFNLPFPDIGKFDQIIATGCVNYVYDPIQFFKNLVSCSKQGTELVLEVDIIPAYAAKNDMCRWTNFMAVRMLKMFHYDLTATYLIKKEDFDAYFKWAQTERWRIENSGDTRTWLGGVFISKYNPDE